MQRIHQFFAGPVQAYLRRRKPPARDVGNFGQAVFGNVVQREHQSVLPRQPFEGLVDEPFPLLALQGAPDPAAFPGGRVFPFLIQRFLAQAPAPAAALFTAGTLVAWLLAYLGLRQWLAFFALRVPLTPGLFLAPAAAVLLLTMTVIGLQTWWAALANPADSLRQT